MPPSSTDVPTSGTLSYVLAMTNGKVTISLDRTKAPCTVNSFVSLADQGYFDNTKCHRLADSGIFILQCGDPTGTGKGGPGYEFANETDGTETYTEAPTVHSSFWSMPIPSASTRSRTSRSSARWIKPPVT
jgi:peptidyl-prolyl cis-trans isomerase B (cyclophilin B)